MLIFTTIINIIKTYYAIYVFVVLLSLLFGILCDNAWANTLLTYSKHIPHILTHMATHIVRHIVRHMVKHMVKYMVKHMVKHMIQRMVKHMA